MTRIQSHRLRLALTVLGALLCVMAGSAQMSRQPEVDSLRISLVTCDPGPEVFELYGHAAMRVQCKVEGKDVDRVYNYGLFDFNAPGFIFRFVKGETDYFSGSIPTPYFVESYRERGSRVQAFPLNLTADEAQRLIELLEYDVQPEHTAYRYKYFTNNCSTRLLDRLDEALGTPVIYPADSTESYRNLLKEYNAGYPWYQLGIDIALGQDIDRTMTGRARMFNPVELSKTISKTCKADGSLLAGPVEVLVQGTGNVRQPDTPWYAGPLFIFWVVAVVVAAVLAYGVWKHRFLAWLYALWGLIFGLVGCLVWFLTFFSDHEGTSPNMLAWWLNPVWLLLPCLVWTAKLRPFCRWLTIIQSLIALVLLCMSYRLNAALQPVLLVAVMLGVAWAFWGGAAQSSNRQGLR